MVNIKLFLTNNVLIQPPNWFPYLNLIKQLKSNREEFLFRLGMKEKNLDHFLIHRLVRYRMGDFYDTEIISQNRIETIAIGEHDILNSNNSLGCVVKEWLRRYPPPYVAISFPNAEARVRIWFKRNEYSLETIEDICVDPKPLIPF